MDGADNNSGADDEDVANDTGEKTLITTNHGADDEAVANDTGEMTLITTSLMTMAMLLMTQVK